MHAYLLILLVGPKQGTFAGARDGYRCVVPQQRLLYSRVAQHPAAESAAVSPALAHPHHVLGGPRIDSTANAMILLQECAEHRWRAGGGGSE